MDERDPDFADPSSRLLGPDDPYPVIVDNLGASSPILLLGDHAGRIVPRRLGDLGLAATDLERHIAWDIGVAGLGDALSRRLGATFIRQAYSRLVIDCNRAPGAPGSIAQVSDGTTVPANLGISAAAADARVREIFQPYHARIADELGARAAAGRRTLLMSLHSFTPSMAGVPRPWRFGVLHRGDSPFSTAILNGLRAVWGEEAGDNQPYAMDGTDYTVPRHADPLGLDYLELEVRQDLIAEPAAWPGITDDLARIVYAALPNDRSS